MLRGLRIILMWLLALAVPMQGYAAVTMFGCAPGHHGMTVKPSEVAAADHHHDTAVPQHLHAAKVEVASATHHGDSAEPEPARVVKASGTPGKLGKSSCTPCAACCVVAALPAAMVVFQPVPLVDFFVPLAPRGLASFLTKGPERPPRFILG